MYLLEVIDRRFRVLDLKRELDYFISKHTLARGQMLICTTVMSAFLQHAMAVEVCAYYERTCLV